MQIGEFLGPARVSGSVITASVVAVEALQQNDVRTKVVFSNNSTTEAWFVRLGLTASSTDYTYRVEASGNLVLEAPMHTGSISAIQSTSSESGSLMVTEFSTPIYRR